MWYILEKEDEMKVVWCSGNDPLVGNKSWGLFTIQGFNLYEEALNYYAENK